MYSLYHLLHFCTEAFLVNERTEYVADIAAAKIG